MRGAWGCDLNWHKPEGEWLKQLLAQVAAVRPTVAILGYGMASSFGGEAGLPKFKEDLQRLIQGIQALSKEKPVRFKAVTDFLEISLPPADDNFIPRLAPPNIFQVGGFQPGTYVLKIDGHGVLGLTQREWATPQRISGGPPQLRTEQLRQTVIKKNELFFHRWRP